MDKYKDELINILSYINNFKKFIDNNHSNLDEFDMLDQHENAINEIERMINGAI